MIVLITNSIAPYCYDIQQILGLPKHTEYRFRYDAARWIVEDLRKENLTGRRALVVLRDFETGELHPCRYVEITEQTDVGHIRHFRFRLGDYVGEEKSTEMVTTLGSWLSVHGFKNDGGKNFEAYVHDNDGLVEKPSADPDSAWVAVVKKLKDIPSYKDFGFLRIRKIHEGSQIRCMSKTCSGEYSFQIKPGATCAIEVAQYMPSQAGEGAISSPYDVKIQTPTALNAIRDRQRVVGKYDLLRFVFDAPDSSAGKSTEIAILAEQTGDAARYGIHALFVPFEIRRRHWFGRLLVISAGIALLVFAISSKEEHRFSEIVLATIQAVAFVLITLGGAAEFLKDMLG